MLPKVSHKYVYCTWKQDLQAFQSFPVNLDLKSFLRVNDAAVNKSFLNVTLAEEPSCYFIRMGFVVRVIQVLVIPK